MKKLFEMNQEQHDAIMEACKPVRLIMLQCGMPPSPQQNANRAWEKLGNEMGFDYMTVEPMSQKNDHFFLAEEK
jgi:hypothetical protein